MIICIVLGVAFALLGLWDLTIAILGLFKRFRATAPGTLERVHNHKNVVMRHRKIPNLTRFTYKYTVNGKTYRYSGESYHRKRYVLPKTTMVYVKGLPRHAYPNKFKGIKEWVFGILWLLWDGSFLYFAFMA